MSGKPDTESDAEYETELNVDRICWHLAHTLIDFEYRLWLDDIGEEEFENAYEAGYAAGMRNQADMTLSDFDRHGVDVVEAAQRYAATSNVSLDPAWLDDFDCEPDFRKDGIWFKAVPESEIEKHESTDESD